MPLANALPKPPKDGFGILTTYPANNVEIQADANQEVIFNNAGNISDLRVKTDNSTKTLFVKSSTDNIGIGTDTPDLDRKLHVSGNVRIEGDLLVNGNFRDWKIV